ncbi:hypothetical protein HRG_013657 [Hirsutella rhossiliensis]
MLQSLNSLLVAQDSPTISLRTLQTQIAAWGLSRQLRLDDLFEEIVEMHELKFTLTGILAQVNDTLRARSRAEISLRTLKSHLATLGLSRQNIHITEELIERVRFYFYTYGYSDSSIVRDLRTKDGMTVSLAIK